ncbi:50S ribosomal protein L32 [Patescibacteria group bacterium]|nr:50S ribosomal protein L32 [Patescibacteria group bacterium]MBU1472418.1 50S ribosomal protein L32 [Patescibacteria group bacterium]MBU2460233.1 50S ribosomal protein L32 [Patescibacteria group bacterium]MBU2544562.1 50S ribosomal protein L32 [Patescibacteria group bacterium]
MTPLPKRRHSTRRGGKRKASIHVANVKRTRCSNCSSLKFSHRACANCGKYNGKVVLTIKTNKAKK